QRTKAVCAQFLVRENHHLIVKNQLQQNIFFFANLQQKKKPILKSELKKLHVKPMLKTLLKWQKNIRKSQVVKKKVEASVALLAVVWSRNLKMLLSQFQ